MINFFESILTKIEDLSPKHKLLFGLIIAQNLLRYLKNFDNSQGANFYDTYSDLVDKLETFLYEDNKGFLKRILINIFKIYLM